MFKNICYFFVWQKVKFKDRVTSHGKAM